MSKGRFSKSIAAGAVVAVSLSMGAGVADAASKWRPTSGLSGMSPGAFSTVCREIYGGTPTFENGQWACWLPDGKVVACNVEDTTTTNCYTNLPKKTSAYPGSSDRPASAGPTVATAR